MRFAVVEVVPLVGKDDAVLFGLLQVFGEPPSHVLIIVRIGKGGGRYFDQFRAIQAQRIFLFPALGFRDDDQRAVAARIGDEGEADAGVAGRCLDHQATGAQGAAFFGFQDHLAAGAVLHRATGVHEFSLPEDVATGRRGCTLKFNERRVADSFDNAVADMHARFQAGGDI